MAASLAVRNLMVTNQLAIKQEIKFAPENRAGCVKDAKEAKRERPGLEDQAVLEALHVLEAEVRQVPESPAKSPGLRGRNPVPRGINAEVDRLLVASGRESFAS